MCEMFKKVKNAFVWVCALLRFQAALQSNNSRIHTTDSHTHLETLRSGDSSFQSIIKHKSQSNDSKDDITGDIMHLIQSANTICKG